MTGSPPRRPATGGRYARLRRIEDLHPEHDDREITSLFYADFQLAMLVLPLAANLFTFATPRMSHILSATGQFEYHTAKRFIDTALLSEAMLEHGSGAGPGRDAARRVNAMHRRYDIHSDDFVAVGCSVPVLALELADRFGWRPVTEAEREAVRIYYSKEARTVGSHRSLPSTLEEMRVFFDHHLDTQTAFEPRNQRLASAFLAYLPSLLPAPMRPLAAPVLSAQVDPRVLRACGLDVPSALRKRLSTAALTALGKIGPAPEPGPRAKPTGIPALARTVYPHGWTIGDLGPRSCPSFRGAESDSAR